MNGTELAPLELPELLLSILLAFAVIAYMLRAWRRATCFAAALLTGVLGSWLWLADLAVNLRPLPFTARMLDLTGPLTWGGFTFQLQSGAVPVITTSLLLTAAACLIAALINQGWSFAPLALLLVSGYIGLALLTTGPIPASLLAPLFVTMLAALSVFVLQAGRYTSVAGALRMLIPPMLAFPLFLVAFWYIDQISLNPQDVAPQQAAAGLIAFGLLLMLAPVPLHGAQPATAQAAPPYVYALVTLLYQLALLHLVFRTLLAFPFMGDDSVFYEWLAIAGLATAVWGGIAAAGANHPGRLWGYAALHDWGVILLVLAVPGLRSWLLVLFLFSLRAISMLTAAAGLAALEMRLGELTPANLRGAAARLPWNSAAFLLGGLGLAGFPLSAGFTGHWAALQLLAENDWIPAAIVLFASSGAIFSFIRLARNLYGPLENRQLLRESTLSTVFALIVLVVSVAIAVAPQWLDNPITRTLSALRG